MVLGQIFENARVDVAMFSVLQTNLPFDNVIHNLF